MQFKKCIYKVSRKSFFSISIPNAEFRSNRSQLFQKMVFLKVSQNSQGSFRVFLNNNVGYWPSVLSKKKILLWCFPVNFKGTLTQI